MKFSDRMWWNANRKPRTRGDLYSEIVAYWFVAGVFTLVGVFLLGGPYGKDKISGGVLVLLAVIIGVYGTFHAKKDGYIDAIHQQYLKGRTEKMAKLGVKDVPPKS